MMVSGSKLNSKRSFSETGKKEESGYTASQKLMESVEKGSLPMAPPDTCADSVYLCLLGA
jgi:hypothetical protein